MNLSDGTEVVREVDDAPDHTIELGFGHITIGLQSPAPALDLGSQAVSQLGPLALRYRCHLPRFSPVGIGEWILARRPAIHEGQTVVKVLGVGRDRRSAVAGSGSVLRRQPIQRREEAGGDEVRRAEPLRPERGGR